MIKVKRKRKKNPFDDFEPIQIKGLEEIGNDLKNFIKKNSVELSKIGAGDYAEVYKFKTTKTIPINSDAMIVIAISACAI